MELLFKTKEETQEAAKKLGSLLEPGDVLGLIGPLGAGKTTFAVGLAKGLEVSDQYRVTSPTYVYSQIYPGRIPLYHIDLYRIENEKHLFQLGIAEMLGGDGVAIVEWLDLFPNLWREDRLDLKISFDSKGERTFLLLPKGKRFETLAQKWSHLWE